MQVFVFLVIIASFVVGERQTLNLRPIIGILDQPTDSPLNNYGKTYLVASYVKWIESSGGRVVPVPYNSDSDTLKKLFNSLNGILFTGGDLENLTKGEQYYNTANTIFQWAIENNDNGVYYPLWGTCQGFQLLAILAAQNSSVLSKYAYDSENLPTPLFFTEAATNSSLFGNAPQDIFNSFASESITINLHHDGVDPKLFSTNSALADFYNLLSINWDRKFKLFASSFEAQDYPFYGVQFHPERNPYEWDTQENVSHTPDAIKAMNYLSEFFLNEARQNPNAFPSPSIEQNALIYNFHPMFTGNLSESYPEQQTYLFNNLAQYMQTVMSG